MLEARLILTNTVGLHARPAAMLVKSAAKYRSMVTITGNNKSVNGKSIVAVMTMGLSKGDELTLEVSGPDEKECMEELKSIVLNNFGEK